MHKPIYRNLILYLMLSLSSIISAQAPNVIINEFLASNARINYDPYFKEYSDWFELYNMEDSPVNLNGYYLSDDLANPTKWKIQYDLTIGANGYLVLWADDGDFEDHANFKLSKSGEQIGLYSPGGSIIDTISYQLQKTDVSFGRNPNNENEWLYYYSPTPNQINNTVGYADLDFCEPPTFSIESGFYSSDLSLEITADSGTEIRYTLDGSEPDENSNVYLGPINIFDRSTEPNYFSNIPTNASPSSWFPTWSPPLGIVSKATIIRAKVFASNKLPSEILTGTFFIGSELANAFKAIPVISLISDQKHFFSDSAGIYVPGESYSGSQGTGNYMKDWNRPAHVEFFNEVGHLKFSQEVNIRTQGQTSRTSPQKGLHIIASNLYGKGSFEYPLYESTEFSANNITSFRRFIIRAWGSVWNQGMVNDALAQLSYAKSSLDLQAYRPVIVFINGEYWGLHEIREPNKNPYYFEEHHGIDRNDPGIDLIAGGLSEYFIDEGDDEHWKKLANFINNNDLAHSPNYEHVNTLIDVDNFVDYIGHCVFFAKIDWPRGNEAFWRPKTLDGRWRWIQFDMDLCFGVPDYNMFEHVLYGTSQRQPHPILIEIIKNEDFKFKFVNWFLDRINSDYKTEVLFNNYNKILIDLYPHLEEHQNRWAVSKNNFSTFASFIRNFLTTRPNHIKTHLQSFFDLGQLNNLTIERNVPGGTVKINTVSIDEDSKWGQETPYPWNGQYFSDIPINLIAKPYDGYAFDGWTGSIQSNSDSISMYLSKNSWISAVFTPMQGIDSLYINEILVENKTINSDSDGEFGSWVELYNSSNDTINLSDIFLTDDYSKPAKWKMSVVDSLSLTIEPKKYKILWCDGKPQNGPDHTNITLKTSGGQFGIVQIVGTDTVFVDSVSYPLSSPNISFGRVPDASDNWKLLAKPTPGEKNLHIPSDGEINKSPELMQNYPNPFSDFTIIPIYVSDFKVHTLSIYDINGALIKEFTLPPRKTEYRSIVWDGLDYRGKPVPSGVYLYGLYSNKLLKTKRMLYIK